MKKALCRLFAVILAILLVASAVTAVSAAAPTDSYTYWTNVGTQRKAVYGKAMYDVDDIIDVTKIGVNKLTQITSMCKDNDENIYILDSNSRIVVLDKNFNLVKELGLIDGSITYNNAKGIYYKDDIIYICINNVIFPFLLIIYLFF